jgi:hypothetical protein
VDFSPRIGEKDSRRSLHGIEQELPDAPMNEIDFAMLLYRLTGKACHVLNVFRFSAGTYVVDGIGKSPEDFATDALVLLFNGEIEYSGDEGGLYARLATAMERDILDCLKSKARKTTTKVLPVSGSVTSEGDRLPGLDDYDIGLQIHKIVEEDIFQQKLYSLLETEDKELYELAVAVFEYNALTPREIADVIGTDSADIQNRKKRFKTFLARQSDVFSEERTV